MDLMDALLSSDYDDEEEAEAEPEAAIPSEEKDDAEDAWDDLLGEIDFEEPPETESQKPNLVQNLLGRFRKSDTESSDADADIFADSDSAPFADDDDLNALPTAADEAGTSSKKPQRAGMLANFSRGQKIILGMLLCAVLLVYIGLITIVFTSTRKPEVVAEPSATLAVIMPGTTTVEAEMTITPTAEISDTVYSEDPTPVPTSVAPTPLPTPTIPTPLTKFDRDLKVTPDDIALRLNRGNEYLELHAYEAAKADFEHVIAVEKERAEAYDGLGRAFFHLGRWEEAEIVFSTAVSFDETLPEPHFDLAMLYYYLARYKQAAGEFDWAAELNPDFVEAECWLAIAAARSDDPAEALAAASRAYSLTQDLPLVYVARSWAWRMQDPPDIDSAQGDLLYARDLEPYDFEVLNAMARFYTEHRPERMAEAEQLARYAVDWARTDINRARGLHTLGRIYLVQGRKEEAREVLSEAADAVMADERIGMPEIAEDLQKTFAP